MRTLKLYLLKSVLPAFALVFCVLLAVNCRSTVDGIGMLSGDYTSPEIESGEFVNGGGIQIAFVDKDGNESENIYLNGK